MFFIELLLSVLVIIILFAPFSAKRHNQIHDHHTENMYKKTIARQWYLDIKKRTRVTNLKTGHELKVIDTTKNSEIYILETPSDEKVLVIKMKLTHDIKI